MPMKKNILVILLLSILLQSFAQNFADKSYYLIDSLDISLLGEEDLILLDTTLKSYRQQTDEIQKIIILSDVCEKMVSQNW